MDILSILGLILIGFIYGLAIGINISDKERKCK